MNCMPGLTESSTIMLFIYENSYNPNGFSAMILEKIRVLKSQFLRRAKLMIIIQENPTVSQQF